MKKKLTREDIKTLAEFAMEAPANIDINPYDRTVFIAGAENFFNTFSGFVTTASGIEKYPYEFYAIVGGVKFYTISETEAPF